MASTANVREEVRPDLRVEVQPEFTPYAAAAVTRLGYLYPQVSFSFDGKSIAASGVDEGNTEELRRDISHTLYREKVLEEAKPQRAAAYRRIFVG